jgi:hypothetical protein
MTEACHEHDVRIPRMDDDTAHLLNVLESDMLPRVAAVGRFEDPVADAEIGAVQALTGPDVEDVWVRRGNGYVPYGAGRSIVENWLPCATKIIRLPNPAAMDAGEEYTGLAGNTDPAHGAAGAKRTDETITKLLVERRNDGVGR